MLKRTVIFLLCALPMFAIAQDKFGHVNSEELVMAMPELASIEKELEALQSEWEGVLLSMQEELFSKFREFQERQSTMPESIREARQSEMAEAEQRIITFRQTAQADLQRKHQELFTPVIAKVRRAIEEVGTENNFTYIFDLAAQSIIFHSPKANDVTALVKAKLGIR